MMVTLLGAAVSDGLEDGRVVSGVGGQLNFVMQAMDLPDARSILCLRATRESAGQVQSNIRYAYGHTTVPRHLRDLVVTEYGVADLRGRTDSEIVAALLAIADSRFQPELLAEAQRNGKISRSYVIPEAQRHNTPRRLAKGFVKARNAGLFEAYPFGTDFTPDEIKIARALRYLASATANLRGKIRTAMAALGTDADAAFDSCIERMGLATPQSIRERIYRLFLRYGLSQTP
jgi:Acetyl-CoA hydrolase/transferase C-terminal domain